MCRITIRLYRGTYGNTVEVPLRNIPPHRCLAQAGPINGAQVMTACYGLGDPLLLIQTSSVFTQLWITLRVATYGDHLHGPEQEKWITFLVSDIQYSRPMTQVTI